MNYVIFAGVNGAGKSTLYNLPVVDKVNLGIRINVDEIVRKEYGHQWENMRVQLEAGKRAINLIKDCMQNKISFNRETTLSGKSIISNVIEAKKQGFTVTLYYIGLNSTELSIERVAHRVKNGGHGIDEAILRSRYIKSFENLKSILPLCDTIFIYDNSIEFKYIMGKKNGEIIYLSTNIPCYLQNIIT